MMTARLRAIIWSSLVILLGTALGPLWADEGGAQWIRQEKMKAVFNPDTSDEEVMATLKEIGMNTLMCYGSYDLEKVKPAIAMAEKYGFHILLMNNLRAGEEIPRAIAKGVRLFVREDGAQPKMTPCPLDARFWESSIFERALPLAEYSKDHPLVAGFLSDYENYAPYGEWADSLDNLRYCYCEGCLNDFFKTRGMSQDGKAIPPAERMKWLESKGLLPYFQEWERQQLEAICRNGRAKIDAMNPDFFFGCFPGLNDYSYLAWDMARGLGTERAPFIVMPESYSGLQVNTPLYYDRLEQSRVPALVVTGLWPNGTTPLKYATNLYLAQTLADGYWLYYERITLKNLLVLRDPAAPPAVVGSPEQWRNAFLTARTETAKHEANPDYLPRLVSLNPGQEKRMVPLRVEAAHPSPGVQVRNQSWSRFLNAPFRGHQPLVEANAPGDSVSFDLGGAIPEDSYDVFLYLSQAPDFGIVQAYFGSEKIGAPLDCYSARRAEAGSDAGLLPMGRMTLNGQSQITFQVVGKNAKSSGDNFAALGYRLTSFSPFCKEWMVLGPFPNPEQKGLDNDYLQGWRPDGKPDLTYIGKGGQEIKWQHPQVKPNNYVDFREVFGQGNNGVAYAYTWVKCPKAGRKRLSVNAAEGMVRIWVNGQEASYGPDGPGRMPDYGFVDVDLKAGWNSLLFGVSQGGLDWIEWKLRLRVSDPRGELLYSTAPE